MLIPEWNSEGRIKRRIIRNGIVQLTNAHKNHDARGNLLGIRDSSTKTL